MGYCCIFDITRIGNLHANSIYYIQNKKKMKMTPEQKAFYEYGRAVESLRGTIYKIRKNAIHGFGEPYRRLMMHEQKCLINAMGLASKIHVVRQKRAACRAWQRRRCETCLHRDDEYPYTCDMCSRSHYASDNWEPRKDGE